METSRAAENSFTAVRLLAALQVAYVHATWHLDVGFTPNGWITQFPGVPIFFAVSGYLFFGSLLRLQSIPRFLLHRAARIYPALAVNIVVIETLLFLAGQVDYSSVSAPRTGLFLLTYVLTASFEYAAQFFGGTGARSFTGFWREYPSGVLWTLTLELTFYAVVPVFLFLRSRMMQTVLVVVLSLMSLVLQWQMGAEIGSAKYMPYGILVFPYFWMFGIGMLLRLWPPPSRLHIYAVAMVFLTVIAIAFLRGPKWLEYRNGPTPVEFIETALVAMLGVLVGISSLLRARVLAKTDASYGIYLYHMLIVTALYNVPTESRSWLLIVVVLFGSTILGVASWYLIEHPVLSLLRRAKVPKRHVTPIFPPSGQRIDSKIV